MLTPPQNPVSSRQPPRKKGQGSEPSGEHWSYALPVMKGPCWIVLGLVGLFGCEGAPVKADGPAGASPASDEPGTTGIDSGGVATADDTGAPAETRCDGANLETCTDDDASWSWAPCSHAQTCAVDVCHDHVCVSDSVTCAANAVSTCAPDGLSVVSTGDCSATQTCGGGVCEDHVCVMDSSMAAGFCQPPPRVFVG